MSENALIPTIPAPIGLKAEKRALPLVKTLFQPGTMQLSQKERDLCLWFLENESYKETAKLLSEKWKKKFHWKTVAVWIDRKPHVRDWLGEEFSHKHKWELFTQGKWGGMLVEGMEGTKKFGSEQVTIAKLIGLAKGWAKENVMQQNMNQQINFTQADGEK